MNASSTLDRCGASPRGVPTSNTPPATRQKGGEDWFEGVFYLRWDPEKFQSLTDILDQESGAVREGVHETGGFIQTLPGAGLWKIHGHGLILGDRGKGPRMRWRLERDGVRFSLANRAEPHKTNPSGSFLASGDVMIAMGSAERVWELMRGWLLELGATIVKAKVSRVDLCVDLPGEGVGELVQAYREERYITRTRDSEDWGSAAYRKSRRDTGLAMGCGTRVRVYEKSIECKDLAKRAWMIKRRWGGKDQEAALRVEFQVRRDFLKEHGIDTVEDYFAKRRTLARYLCSDWCRFVDHGFDKRHTDRAVNLPIWDRVVEYFDEWTGGGRLGQDLSPLPREAVLTSALVRQAIGCLETVAARMGEQVIGSDDFLGFASDRLWGLLEDDRLVGRRVRHKTNTLTMAMSGQSERTHGGDAPDGPCIGALPFALEA